MNDDHIAKIANQAISLAAAASSGPWEFRSEAQAGCPIVFVGDSIAREHRKPINVQRDQDGAFIAAARDGLPALAQAVLELKRDLDAARNAVPRKSECQDFPECSCPQCKRQHAYHSELTKLTHERDEVTAHRNELLSQLVDAQNEGIVTIVHEALARARVPAANITLGDAIDMLAKERDEWRYKYREVHRAYDSKNTRLIGKIAAARDAAIAMAESRAAELETWRNCFICPECGRGAADGDGCCTTCGSDCIVFENGSVVVPAPSYREAEQDNIAALIAHSYAGDMMELGQWRMAGMQIVGVAELANPQGTVERHREALEVAARLARREQGRIARPVSAAWCPDHWHCRSDSRTCEAHRMACSMVGVCRSSLPCPTCQEPAPYG